MLVVLDKDKIFERLRELGAEPKRSLGQNFLVSERAIGQIIGAVQRMKPTSLLEVGPGLGSLTESLLGIEAPFEVIELDQKFSQYWRDRGVKVTEADALKLDWKELGLTEGTLLVSNLPYQISSSLVIERCLEPAGISRMILMFQKEVAQRLLARARTEEYGLLSVIAQTFWKMSNLIDVSPREFYPAPNVASRVVNFENLKTQMPAGGTPDEFLKLAKTAFAHRRKVMIKNLGAWGNITSDAWKPIFESLGLSLQARAEELDPPMFLRLYDAALKAQGK